MAKLKFGDASSVFLGLKQQPGASAEPDPGLTEAVEEKLARVADSSPHITTQLRPQEKPAPAAEPPRPPAKAARKAPEPPPEPEKVVKDSFSMPPADYERLLEMERVCMRNLRKAPRSVLLRLGVRLLAARPEKELLALVDGVLAEGKGGRKG